ncbi:MAG: hypothetical protein ACU0GG_14045 [Paracoccaceae bacterium]
MHSEATTQQMVPVSERLGACVLGLLSILSFRKEPHDKVLEDVKRIALLSPHLLKDIGFRYEPQTSNPITAMCQKDDIIIWIQCTQRHVIVQRER